MKPGRPPIPWSRIEAVLSTHVGLSAAEIGARANLSRPTVMLLLNAHAAEVREESRQSWTGRPQRLFLLRAAAPTSCTGNPFLVAVGLVAPYETVSGRVHVMRGD